MGESGTVYTVGVGDAGKRLDRFLAERIPKLSRARIQRAILERVTLSWSHHVRPASRLQAGGEIRVGFAPLQETPLDIDLPILARGAGWLAVDKPPHMPVHPVNHTRANSLIKILRRQEGLDALRLVHRLDSETSGVLLVAEEPSTARSLSTAFERGEVRKEYLALVHGVVRDDEGVIDLPIGAARRSQVFVRLEAGVPGKSALTRWRVEQRLELRTLVRVFPRTGRRHQIRVHLASIGHPILGDLIYGRSDQDYLDVVRGVGDPRRARGGPQRHLLHNERLVFPIAGGSATADVRAPLPPDFLAMMRVREVTDPPRPGS